MVDIATMIIYLINDVSELTHLLGCNCFLLTINKEILFNFFFRFIYISSNLGLKSRPFISLVDVLNFKLRVKSPRSIIRGKLTYVHCTCGYLSIVVKKKTGFGKGELSILLCKSYLTFVKNYIYLNHRC